MEYSFFLSKFNAMGITLGRKSLRNGRLSLYLDYCFNGKRQRQYLGIILDSPTDKHTRATNRAKLQLAQVLRSQKEIEYLKERYPFRTTEMPFTLPQTPETASISSVLPKNTWHNTTRRISGWYEEYLPSYGNSTRESCC